RARAVTADRMAAELRRGPDGRLNWVFAQAAIDDGAADLPTFRVRNAQLTVPAADGAPIAIDVRRGRMSTGSDGRLALDAEGGVAGRAVGVTGAIGSVAAIAAGTEWPAELELELGGAEATLAGTVALAPAGPEADLALEFSVPPWQAPTG